MSSRPRQQKSITIPTVAPATSASFKPNSLAAKTPKAARQQQTTANNKTISTTTNRNIFNSTANKPKQEGYFAKTNPTFAAGGNFMTNHMQQMETIPGARPPSTSSTTPTSLANLAQLSGITLLPMKATNAKPKMIINKPSTQDCISKTPNLIATTVCDRKPNVVATTTTTTNKSTHNLANISSVQILNQSSLTMPMPPQQNYRQPNTINKSHATTSRNNIRNNSNSASNKRQYKQQQQQQPKPINPPRNISNARGQRKNTTKNNNNNNDFQVIPKNEPLPSYSSYEYLPRQTNNVEDILSQPSQEESIGYQSSSSANNYADDEMNNISLLKLMAILNNPALTITPVDSNYNNSSTTSRYSTFDDFQTTTNNNVNSYESNPLSITALSGNINSQINHQQAGCSGITISGHKSHSQQQSSSRNLKTESLCPPFEQSSSLELHLTANHQATKGNYNGLSGSHTLEPADIQLNWLDDYVPQNSFDCLSASFDSNNQSNVANRNNDQPTISTSVRNIMMQQLPSTSREPNTVSVELLKQVSNQTFDKINHETHTMSMMTTMSEKVLEDHHQDCMMDIPRRRRSIQQNTNPGVKISESCDIVTTENCLRENKKRRRSTQMESSKDRLYIPRNEFVSSQKKFKMIDEISSNYNSIKITAGKERQVYLSEQHFILDNMMRNGDEVKNHQKSAIPEPDDIFINRSKRIMSKIDTMIERKKRRRFERISSRADPKTNSMEDQCEESENEWSDDDIDGNKLSLESNFIPIQVPLDEVVTPDKREHLLSVGLVSRTERNRLLVEQAEKKFNLISPILMEPINEVSPDVRRFVDTIVQTGGGIDVQLCINSDIKRNELPLIEGLNRNTSRLKMSFMNTLGLEKRSKRTTLYKVKTSNDTTNNILSNNPTTDTPGQGQADLSRNKGSSCSEKQKVDKLMEISKSLTSINNKLVANNGKATISQVSGQQTKLKLTTCRDAIKPPNKDEYMKSLGLMAS